MSDWWLGVPAAQTRIDCGGQRHRLRWDAGVLQALDHEDAEGERTLAALGGEGCACVDALDAWSRHADDLRVLLLGRRGPADAFAAPTDHDGPYPGVSRRRRRGSRVFGTAYRPAPAGMPPSGAELDELIALVDLGGALADRLAATVAASWARRLEQADPEVDAARAQLHAALYGRVVSALRVWLGEPELRVDLRLADAGETPSLADAGAGAIAAVLPFAWLVDVWSKGLAVVWGRFVLAAALAGDGRWTLTAVAPDLGPPRQLTVESL